MNLYCNFVGCHYLSKLPREAQRLYLASSHMLLQFEEKPCTCFGLQLLRFVCYNCVLVIQIWRRFKSILMHPRCIPIGLGLGTGFLIFGYLCWTFCAYWLIVGSFATGSFVLGNTDYQDNQYGNKRNIYQFIISPLAFTCSLNSHTSTSILIISHKYFITYTSVVWFCQI